MTEIFSPAAHLHVSPCPLTGNFALRATATHRWQSGSGGSGSHGGPGGSGGVSRPLQDPSPKAKLASELADAEEGHLLEADEGHLGDLAMMANGSCSTLSTLKSACAHSHQMAIAPCGRGFLSFLSSTMRNKNQLASREKLENTEVVRATEIRYRWNKGLCKI